MPGWTWRGRDGRSMARMDVAWPGWTWRGRQRRGGAGSVLRGLAASVEGRQRP